MYAGIPTCICATHVQHPAGNELCFKWLTSLPDDCNNESYGQLAFHGTSAATCSCVEAAYIHTKCIPLLCPLLRSLFLILSY